MITCSLIYLANCFRATNKESVYLCAWAHLRQSWLFMGDFMFAYGCQLLQRVAVVGERPCQPRKLGPSCRNETLNTAYITFITTRLALGMHINCHIMTHTNTIRPRQLSTTSVDTVPQFIMTPGTYWSCKIFPQLSFVLATRGLAVPQLVIHIYNKPGTMWMWHKPCFHAKQPPCRKCPWTRLDLHQLQGFCSAAAHCALTSAWKPELKENFSFRGSIQQESL